MFSITRRRLVAGIAAVAFAPLPSEAGPSRSMQVWHDPGCGCCLAWVEHLRAAGFEVEVTPTATINRVKKRLSVPDDLASCHTAEIAGYVLEGHVPAGAVERLMAERPRGRGLAVPGMPLGSPGMEAEGAPPDEYEVVLFDGARRTVFARYRGSDLLPA
jgi:hypothetical protein